MKTLNFILTLLLIAACFFLYQKNQELATAVQKIGQTSEIAVHPAASNKDEEITDQAETQKIHEYNYVDENEESSEELEALDLEEQKLSFIHNSTHAWGQVIAMEDNTLTLNMRVIDVDSFFKNYDLFASSTTKEASISINDETIFEDLNQNKLTTGQFVKIYTTENIYTSSSLEAEKITSFDSAVVNMIHILEAEENIVL